MSRALNVRFKYPRGIEVLYSGDLDARGRPNGYGEQVQISQDQYEGQVHTGVWERGSLHGVSRIVCPNGERKTGEFFNNNLNGVGYYEHLRGQRYAGQFKGGKRQGVGTITHGDGRVIVGWWENDKLHGIALRVAADGSKAAVTYSHDVVVSRSEGLIA
jgi:hypothetical protein